MAKGAKRYIGDAVYVEFDGWFLILTTENGVSVTNRIMLEPDVYQRLAEFVGELLQEQTAGEAQR